MSLGSARDQLVVQLERVGHRLGVGLPQSGRALDVREEEGHDAGRELNRSRLDLRRWHFHRGHRGHSRHGE